MFPGGETWRGRVLDAVTDLRYQIEYDGGTVTTFTLEPDGDGWTELVLTDEGVVAEDVIDVEAGWVSVLMALKAAVDHGVDLRNHRPDRSYRQKYADNWLRSCSRPRPTSDDAVRSDRNCGGEQRQNRRVPDAIFDDPRLAQVYDPLDPDRSDLDVYVDMVHEFGATSVLDVGCGTGTFACMLTRQDVHVTAVDPAGASLDVARAKPGAHAVDWLLGDATTLPALSVDAAFMTANVAQVFLTDDDWAATLRGIRDALRPRGMLVFETRDPARRAWEQWTPELTRTVVDVPGVGLVESWEEVTTVDEPLVTFRSMTAFRHDDLVLESTSTLRFRDRSEIEDSLVREGYELTETRDAPDRPGRELVFLSRRAN